MKLLRRLLVGVLVVLVLGVWFRTGGPLRAVGEWLLVGYVLLRAAPGVLGDVRSLLGRLVPLRGRYAAAGRRSGGLL